MREKKAMAKIIFSQMSDLCLKLTRDGTIVSCYVANADESERSPRELLGLSIDRLLPPSVGQEFLQEILQVSQTQQFRMLRYSLSELEGVNQREQDSEQDSEQYYEVKFIPGLDRHPSQWVQLASAMSDRKPVNGTENSAIAFISNITEQQQELKQLRQENHQLKTCLKERTDALHLANEKYWDTLCQLKETEAQLKRQEQQAVMGACESPVGLWDWNVKENTIYIDPMLKSVLGYSDEEIGNHWDDWAAKNYPEDVEGLNSSLSDDELGKTPTFELEDRMFHKDGTIGWFFCGGKAIKGNRIFPDRPIGSNPDITDCKAIEEALSESDRRFRSIFNQAAIGIAQVALNGQYLQVNQKLCDILGYSQNELLGQSFLNFVYGEDVEKDIQLRKDLMTGSGQNYSLYRHYLNQKGQLVWTNVNTSLVRNSSGVPKYFIQVVQDISDRRKAELALEYSETRYRAIVQDQTELVCRFFPDGTLIFVNDAYCNYLNFSYDDLLGTSYFPLLSESERQIHKNKLAEITPQNPVKTLEYSLNHPDDTISWQQWNIRGFFDPDGCLLELQGVGRDITDRVQAEAERDRFFTFSLDLLCIANFDGYFTRINPAFRDILGYSISEVLAKPFIEFIHPDDHENTLGELQKVREGIFSTDLENRYLCKNGSYKWIAWSMVPFREEGLLYAVGRDITERKQAKAKIQASLEEKEVLLKELHHRVKNNLQIVCSLLELQSQSSADSEVMAMFQESQLRIRSMSFVHESLYQSNDLGHLDVSEYIEQISMNLCTSYGYSPKILHLYSSPKKISINLDTAIQCGLILNELLTNAFKYAFDDREAAKIEIEIHALNSGEFLLFVGDNGIGLPENFDPDNTETIGWRIIRALIRKLKGQIKIASDNGTKISINFSKIKQKSAQIIKNS